ncbi:DUF2850 domain-containing protein [Vibrio sp. 404]|uniref:DUF2850 domain-containing protein n=1 Tax=Vibrio marinisediminis TaxID=2758441 RepID=A0A7W2ISE4_9VIBR|nr:DUF2850 domain-containing protein [Vibrio marinisediminis]
MYSFNKQSTSRKSHIHFSFLHLVFLCCVSAVLGAFSILIYSSYQQYIAPNNVYGRWLEVGTASYNRSSIEFNQNGVFRNQRMVATQFEFDGQQIHVETGSGISIYQLTRAKDTPQLKRIQPNSPTQRFVKQGYEHLIDMEAVGIAKQRRAALANHFNEK